MFVNLENKILIPFSTFAIEYFSTEENLLDVSAKIAKVNK